MPADSEMVHKVALLLSLEEAQVTKVCTTRQITVKGTTTDIALKYHEVNWPTANSLPILHTTLQLLHVGM